MKIKERLDQLRLGAKVWARERKERAEERKRVRQQAAAHDPHAHSRFWLLNVPALATICAAIVEWYWAVLFCIEATGRLGMDWSTSTGSDAPASGAWHFLFDIQNVWVLIGLVLATMPIVMLSMIWLPVQFAMRGAGRVRRGSLIAVGVLANILVIVSGTVVMNYNRQDQVREDLVIEQTAAQGRAAIDARLAFEQEQLRLALNNSNPYLNQAANVGAAEWERSYVAQARETNDPRLPMLERALGAARAADQRRANIEQLTIQRAQAAPEAASAAIVQDTVGAELNTFAQYVEVWRPPFVAFICTLIGIFGAWWTLAMLERINPKDVLRSGWADEGHRIEDLRDEEPVAANPPVPPRQRRKVYNPETGREEVFVQPKGYWRSTGKKQRNADGTMGELNEFVPEVPESETGVQQDGGGRMASKRPEEEGPDEQPDTPGGDESNQRPEEAVQEPVSVAVQEAPSEEPNYDDYLDAGVLTDLAPQAPVDEPHADEQPAEGQEPDQQSEHVELPNGEGMAVIEQDEPAQREPETDPARLIAAE